LFAPGGRYLTTNHISPQSPRFNDMVANLNCPHSRRNICDMGAGESLLIMPAVVNYRNDAKIDSDDKPRNKDFIARGTVAIVDVNVSSIAVRVSIFMYGIQENTRYHSIEK
jgi:hypothetical protein